jgi:hypothetical protein
MRFETLLGRHKKGEQYLLSEPVPITIGNRGVASMEEVHEFLIIK